MFLCVDVHYSDSGARAAGVVFKDNEASTTVGEYVKNLKQVKSYIPGKFFERELPCILALLEEVEESLQAIIVDGHVWLLTERHPGLGAKLHYSLDKKIPVIGVAKTPYRESAIAVKVYRGQSSNPLYVTAAGMDKKSAAQFIRKMHGTHRIPSLLKQVDRLSRQRA